MRKKTTFIFFSILLSFSCSHAQLISDEMITEKETLVSEKRVIKEVYNYLRKYNNQSPKQLKKHLKNQFDSLSYRKAIYIKDYRQHKLNDEHEFSSKQRKYTSEEERYDDILDPLVTKDHQKFKKYIQNNLFYNQTYTNDKSELRIPLANNGAYTYNYELKRHALPYPQLSAHSEKTNEIEGIYYHDGTIDSIFRTEVYDMPLNPCRIPNLKHIDSIRMKFTITYLTKVDTISFTKADIEKEKMGIELKSIDDNYIRYATNGDDYPYKKGVILDEEVFNSKNQILESEFSTTYGNEFKKAVLYFAPYEKLVIKNYEDSKKLTKTKDILNLLKYNNLNNIILQEKENKVEGKSLVRALYKGNIDRIKFYIENARDTMVYETTFRNNSPVKDYYVHTIKNNTEFIDKNGKIIYYLPFEVNFLKSSKLNITLNNYFTKEGDYSRDYYFVDVKNKKHSKLAVNSFKFLSPSLLMAYDETLQTSFLRNTIENKHLSTVSFSRSMINTTDKKEVVVFDKKGVPYILFDQNGTLITEETNTPITKITIKPFTN